jgi:hypothetical protein
MRQQGNAQRYEAVWGGSQVGLAATCVVLTLSLHEAPAFMYMTGL